MSQSPEDVVSSPKAIQHYNIGNDFYQLWLDESLTYSCPLWDGPNDTLHAAQLRKLDYHATNAKAIGAARVLDIGCGWGSMMERLVNVHGVQHAVGLTLSQEQADLVKARNLPRSSVLLSHWHDHRPEEKYDAIISIGAFEHFVHIDENREQRVRSYRKFFTHCRELLKPGGMMSLQTTVYEMMDQLDPFITSRIWPEAQLPRLVEMIEAMDYVFEVVKIDNHKEHYERALIEWANRLAAKRDEAIKVTSTEIVDDYLRYLKMSAKAYRVNGFSLQRLGLRALPAR
ncbi:MAG TPA: class I SAM-dependent methyltransferase [Kofleriaceae bacterium]|jgi:cyclopropane-fatty-acyl-phospholipid synthase|nr:class I SAM-dependent methyltransferase [Kofleriaceae bacterium]